MRRQPPLFRALVSRFYIRDSQITGKYNDVQVRTIGDVFELVRNQIARNIHQFQSRKKISTNLGMRMVVT